MTQHQDTQKKTQELPPSPYAGLDRMSMLVSSLGTLRLALMNAVNTQTALDTSDCHALAAFVTLLEEDLERVIDGMYPARQK